MVHFYEEQDVFLDTLEEFRGRGVSGRRRYNSHRETGHAESLEARLCKSGVDVVAARVSNEYVALSAEATLQEFMVDGWPDDALFDQTVSRLLERSRTRWASVRAFGEMVACLWEQGHNGATVRLEHLGIAPLRTRFSLASVRRSPAPVSRKTRDSPSTRFARRIQCSSKGRIHGLKRTDHTRLGGRLRNCQRSIASEIVLWAGVHISRGSADPPISSREPRNCRRCSPLLSIKQGKFLNRPELTAT